MARVILEKLSKSYAGPNRDKIRAVNEVSLTVEDGELLALVGPSGCGKTTTLRLIAGLEKPEAGTISLDGCVINDLPPKDRDVAMVFQNHALYPHLTAFENMAFGLKLRRVPRNEIEQRVGQAAELLGLTDCLDRLPKALSGGQRQRVALGRAVVRRPRVLLFDEPLSNLDAPLRVQLRREIAQLQRQLGATIIHVTHDQSEALALGEQVAVMKHGNIQQVAEPLTLYRQPANLFVAGFIGSPPMNFFRGALVSDGGGFFFESEKATGCFRRRLAEPMVAGLGPFANTPVILGLRPESVCVVDQSRTPETPACATVEQVETTGADAWAHLRIGERIFVARISPDHSLAIHDDVAVAFDTTQAHFFDPATGQRLV